MSWLGAALVVVGAYFCGISLAMDESDKLKTIESLVDLVAYMKRRMSTELVPLSRIFAEYEGYPDNLDAFLAMLRGQKHSLFSVWQSAVDTLCIDEATKKELLRFGESLGRLSLDEQLKRLDSVYLFLLDKKRELADSLPARKKSIKAVCTLIGMITAIILL